MEANQSGRFTMDRFLNKLYIKFIYLSDVMKTCLALSGLLPTQGSSQLLYLKNKWTT